MDNKPHCDTPQCVWIIKSSRWMSWPKSRNVDKKNYKLDLRTEMGSTKPLYSVYLRIWTLRKYRLQAKHKKHAVTRHLLLHPPPHVWCGCEWGRGSILKANPDRVPSAGIWTLEPRNMRAIRCRTVRDGEMGPRSFSMTACHHGVMWGPLLLLHSSCTSCPNTYFVHFFIKTNRFMDVVC